MLNVTMRANQRATVQATGLDGSENPGTLVGPADVSTDRPDLVNVSSNGLVITVTGKGVAGVATINADAQATSFANGNQRALGSFLVTLTEVPATGPFPATHLVFTLLSVEDVTS